VPESASDGQDLAGLIQELTARSVSEQARTLQRYRELVERVAAGQLDPETVRLQYDRLLAEQSAQFARDVATLGARYYEAVLELNGAYVERLFDRVAGAARVDPVDAVVDEPEEDLAEDDTPSLAELTLEGTVGATVEATFLIENKRAEPADVIFLLSDFTSDGSEPFRAALELDPPRFALPPYGERSVTLRLLLDKAQFAPGQTYRGALLIRGLDDLQLQLKIAVAEKPAAPKRARSASARSPAAKRPRARRSTGS